MTTHRFAIGDTVELSLPQLGISGRYKIVRLLPRDASEYQYRIKSESETYERVARESQLQPVG